MSMTTPVSLPYVVPRARRGTGTRTDAEIDRARKLARLLDDYLLDPVIGLLIPGAGDVIGSLLGLYPVAIALRRKMSPVIIARMLLNLGLDALLGIVPLLGDIVDVGLKANKKNLALLESHVETGGKATRKDWLVVIGAGLAFGAAIGLSVYLMSRIVRAIGSLL
jgi:hypothetical protein